MSPLFRYFSEENAHAFLDRGEVLLRALSYYRDFEDKGVRSDALEGTLVHLPKNGLRVRLQSTGKEVVIPYTFEATAKEDDIFVYCLSTELSSTVAQRFQAPIAVEITESQQFLSRLRSALQFRDRMRPDLLVHDVVRYYEWHEPPIVDWALPERISLRKPKSFEWQCEYRIAVPAGDAFAVENVQVKLVPLGIPRSPRVQSYPQLLLKLGSLRDLCRMHRM